MLKEIIVEYLKDADFNYSIYIKDLKLGKIYTINQCQTVPSASIIKLFIKGAVLQLVNEGKISLKDKITINNEEKVPYSILTIFGEDNSYSVKELVLLMIMYSDNTATNKLIDITGMHTINKFIVDSGFNNTILQRKMMDYESRKVGKDNLTNAQETAQYLERIYNGQLIKKEFCTFMLNVLKKQSDHSMMRLNLPQNLTVANKTGDLDFIKHDAGIVFTPRKDYIFTMFTWDAASDNAARSVIGTVSRITYDYFTGNMKSFMKNNS